MLLRKHSIMFAIMCLIFGLGSGYAADNTEININTDKEDESDTRSTWDNDSEFDQDEMNRDETDPSTEAAPNPGRDRNDSRAYDDETLPGQQSDKVGEIEPGDVNELQRRRQAKYFGMAGLGPAALGNLNADNISYNVFGGGVWEVNPNASIKATGEATSDFDNSVMVNAGVGANFIPINGDISPYLGGQLGLGYANGFSENLFGFDLGASLGALMFRTSDTQMNLETNASILLDEVQDQFPVRYSARVGILF